MIITNWLYDPWFISLATIFLTLIIEQAIIWIIKYIRASFGVFSGYYLEISGKNNFDEVLLEVVKCKQVGNRISGSIKGACFVKIGRNKLILTGSNDAKYSFTGVIKDRLFLISYCTTNPGAKGAGTITLQVDGNGKVCQGVWGGFDINTIVSSPCVWVKIDNKNIIHNTEEIINFASEFLVEFKNLERSMVLRKFLSHDSTFNLFSENEWNRTIELRKIRRVE